jgi:hypothetical protein
MHDAENRAMVASSFTETSRLQFAFDRPDYSVVPGGTVAVTVFLRETFNPVFGSSLLAPGTDGLISGGFMIRARSATPTRPARVRSTSAIAGNPAFDFAIIPQLPVPAFDDSAGVVALSSTPVFGEFGSRTTSWETVLLPLGSFTFTAGFVPGEVTYLTALNTEINMRMASDTFVTASGRVLDGLLEPGSATITVTMLASETPSLADEACLKGTPGHSNQPWWRRNP